MAETPAERALRYIESDDDLLEVCARTLYETREDIDRSAPEDLWWENLLEFEREKWRTAALEMQREFAGLPTELQETVNAVEHSDWLARHEGIEDD